MVEVYTPVTQQLNFTSCYSIFGPLTYIEKTYRIPVLNHTIHASTINSWFNTYDSVIWWFPPSIFNWTTLSEVLIWSNITYKISVRRQINIFDMARIIKSSVFSTHLTPSTLLILRFETSNLFNFDFLWEISLC
jgi:hypothetical protein